jgi:hypothetical protein
MVGNFIVHALLAVVPVVLAITLHEAAHGYAALALGAPSSCRASC